MYPQFLLRLIVPPSRLLLRNHMTQPLSGQADWTRGGPGPRVAHSQAGNCLVILSSLKSSDVLFWKLLQFSEEYREDKTEKSDVDTWIMMTLLPPIHQKCHRSLFTAPAWESILNLIVSLCETQPSFGSLSFYFPCVLNICPSHSSLK